jgi:ribosome biogenesis protein BMS1
MCCLSKMRRCPVEPVKLYNPVTSLLIAKPADWSGMRTVRELRLEQRLAVPNKADSEYKPVVRTERHFNALKIPRKLQADLPFKSKPKLLAASKRHKGKEGYLQKRAVVLEPVCCMLGGDPCWAVGGGAALPARACSPM